MQEVFNAEKRNGAHPVKLLLMGTNFQIKVWEALLSIPSGSVVSYQDLARRLGKPSAARAVGSAVGQNPISFLIPCHRAIRKMGITGDYHWGSARKKAILAWEAARQSSCRSRSVGGNPETAKSHSERSEDSRAAAGSAGTKDQGEIPRCARNDSLS